MYELTIMEVRVRTHESRTEQEVCGLALSPGEGEMNGKIVRLMSDKGYGFIKGDDGKEYFFHRADFQEDFESLCMDVERGQKVDVVFESVPSPKGPRAGEVIRNYSV